MKTPEPTKWPTMAEFLDLRDSALLNCDISKILLKDGPPFSENLYGARQNLRAAIEEINKMLEQVSLTGEEQANG